MTTPLSNSRRWWRPVLGWGTTFNCIAYPWGALLIAFFNPEMGSTALAMLTAMLGFGAALFGIRQIGKNQGVED